MTGTQSEPSEILKTVEAILGEMSEWKQIKAEAHQNWLKVKAEMIRRLEAYAQEFHARAERPPRDFLEYLYWHTDVPVEGIAHFFGHRNIANVHKEFPPLERTLTRSCCGSTFKIYRSSRISSFHNPGSHGCTNPDCVQASEERGAAVKVGVDDRTKWIIAQVLRRGDDLPPGHRGSITQLSWDPSGPYIPIASEARFPTSFFVNPYVGTMQIDEVRNILKEDSLAYPTTRYPELMERTLTAKESGS